MTANTNENFKLIGDIEQTKVSQESNTNGILWIHNSNPFFHKNKNSITFYENQTNYL
jgi:hypothetical protein